MNNDDYARTAAAGHAARRPSGAPSDNYRALIRQTPAAGGGGGEGGTGSGAEPEAPSCANGAGDGDELGQLLLSVDFTPLPSAAPPSRQPKATACLERRRAPPTRQCDEESEREDLLCASPRPKPTGARQSGAGSSHLVEVSLCVRQHGQPPSAIIHCDRQEEAAAAEAESSQRQVARRRREAAKQKRRLVYERLDRFALELGRTRAPQTSQQQHHLAAATMLAPANWRPRIPVKSNAVDSCLCFNLLNVRVASARLLQLERAAEERSCSEQSGARRQPKPTSNEAENRQELERNWLRMERLTCELRVALLGELARVVRQNGKCVYTRRDVESKKAAAQEAMAQPPPPLLHKQTARTRAIRTRLSGRVSL